MRNDALIPGTRTTELLPALPQEWLDYANECNCDIQSLRTNASVPEPQDAPALRWGILGAGNIAGKFATDIPYFSSGRIAAVSSRSQEKAQEFIESHPGTSIGGAARAYGSYEAMLADDEVEAVYVATPHSHHAQWAIAALEAGKHVLVEKALTINAAQARKIFDAAARTDRFVMEAMWSRFLPSYSAVRACVSAGLLGQVRYLRAEHFQALTHVERLVRPELAGGALLDLGVYPVSFAHFLLGKPTTMDVHGELTDLGVDRCETVLMDYGSATQAIASAGFDTAASNTAVVSGTKARLDLAGSFYTPTALTLAHPAVAGRPSATWDARMPGGFQFEAAEVARCIAAGKRESNVMSWQSSLEVMELMDEIRSRLGVTFPGE